MIPEIALAALLDVFPGHLDADVVRAQVAGQLQCAGDGGRVGLELNVEGVHAQALVGPGDRRRRGRVGDAAVGSVVGPDDGGQRDQQ